MAFNKFDFFNSSIIPLSLDTSHFKRKIERNLNLISVENLYSYSTMEIAASISSTPFPEQTSAVSCKRRCGSLVVVLLVSGLMGLVGDQRRHH